MTYDEYCIEMTKNFGTTLTRSTCNTKNYSKIHFLKLAVKTKLKYYVATKLT